MKYIALVQVLTGCELRIISDSIHHIQAILGDKLTC